MRMNNFKLCFAQISILIFVPLILGCSSKASGDYYLITGSLAEKINWYSMAISQYEKAIALNPRDTNLYISVGNIYQCKLNDKRRAIDLYKRGLSYTPTDYGMNLNIMYAYFDTNDFDKAIEHYIVLSKIDGESFHNFPRDALKKIFIKYNKEEVIIFCKKYLTINPGDIILREKLSEIYMDRKDYKKARPEYEAILKYSRKYDNVGSIYFSLAVCDYYLGSYKSSYEYLDKAKELGESVPDQYFEMVREKLKK
jgi:tetratricopeptide (TPR) repeat protein